MRASLYHDIRSYRDKILGGGLKFSYIIAALPLILIYITVVNITNSAVPEKYTSK